MFKTKHKEAKSNIFCFAQSWNIDNYIESNREKSNIAIAIAILDKLSVWIRIYFQSNKPPYALSLT